MGSLEKFFLVSIEHFDTTELCSRFQKKSSSSFFRQVLKLRINVVDVFSIIEIRNINNRQLGVLRDVQITVIVMVVVRSTHAFRCKQMQNSQFCTDSSRLRTSFRRPFLPSSIVLVFFICYRLCLLQYSLFCSGNCQKGCHRMSPFLDSPKKK